MRNHGYITVFISLLLSLLLLLFSAVYTLTAWQNAKGRGAVALRSAMSSVRAEYHRYIFDQYHVLLLDADLDGEGLGKLETLAEERMQEDLGNDFAVGEVMLTGYTRLMENDLAAFKEQVEKVTPYLAADKGIDHIKAEVRGNDQPLTQANYAQADAATHGGRIDGDGNQRKLAEEAGVSEEEIQKREEEAKKAERKIKDPRRSIGLWQGTGIAYMIAPKDMEISNEVLQKVTLPSYGNTGMIKMEMDAGFHSYSRMKRDTTQTGGWLGGLEADGAGLLYAGSCFNCLTEKVQEDTVLTLEMEYLISGEMTDRLNYKETIDRLVVLRTGINMAYILTDTAKMAICEAAADAICIIFPPAAPVVKYLLAGAWSYVEAVADAWRLVRGKRVPFLKTKDDWMTDFDGAGRIGQEGEEGGGEGSGLTYKEYLYILLAMNMDGAWYRMLDLIQVNANSRVSEGGHLLNMRNAITAFEMSVDVEYGGRTFSLDEEIGY